MNLIPREMTGLASKISLQSTWDKKIQKTPFKSTTQF